MQRTLRCAPAAPLLVNTQLTSRARHSIRHAVTRASSSGALTDVNAHEGLAKAKPIYLVSTGKQVTVTYLWGPEETCVLAFGRSMDPDNAAYDVLPFKKGIKETFFDYETPQAIWKRIKSGNTKDIQDVMKVWTKNELWIPPKQDQAFQQGGVVIFRGKELVWSHYDPATSSHADFEQVVQVALDTKNGV